jgi:hypothetical protein
MLLVMMVRPLTQGSRQVGPDRIEQHRPDGRLRQCALDLPDDVRAHCQIGRVDLEYKAGVDHSAIFVRHLAGDRIQIGLVRGVIRIQHVVAMMPGEGAVMKHSVNGGSTRAASR